MPFSWQIQFPTAFGAVGIPVSILAEQVNLPVYTLGGTIILQLALFNILLPFVIVCIIGGGLKAIRGVFLITLICGISTLIPQYFVAIHLGAELPAFAGSWSACLPWRWSVACAKENRSRVAH
ncbi:L-lactate permease [Shigella sonnei]|uniref:L-lactate permease n=1 Tax=Shigella sonnei TaxID=624 RepID=UPI003C765AFC